MLYFDNIILNLISILVIVALIAILNRLLNRITLKNFSFPCSLDKEAGLLTIEYCNDLSFKEVTVIPTSTPREFDVVMVKRKTVFLNVNDHRSKSFLSIIYALNLSSAFSFCQKHPKHYNIYYIFKPIVNILSAFGWGAIFIGYLFMLDSAIIGGLITIVTTLLFQLYFVRFIKKNYSSTASYLKNKLNKAELPKIDKIHKFNCINFLLDPILNCTRLFPFLLPKNQRFNRTNYRKQKENNNVNK